MGERLLDAENVEVNVISIDSHSAFVNMRHNKTHAFIVVFQPTAAHCTSAMTKL